MDTVKCRLCQVFPEQLQQTVWHGKKSESQQTDGQVEHTEEFQKS